MYQRKIKTINIVGGASFLGSSLGKVLSKLGYEYSICDLNDVCDRIVDIEKPETLEAHVTGDVIINLAAVHRDDIRPLSRYDDEPS